MRNLRWMTAAAAMALLSACGGGDDGNGGGGTVVTPGPAPAPTPTPTPTPTPVTYVRADDFDQDLTSDGMGVTLLSTLKRQDIGWAAVGVEVASPQAGYRYQAAGKIYDVVFGDENLRQVKAEYEKIGAVLSDSYYMAQQPPLETVSFSRNVSQRARYSSWIIWETSSDPSPELRVEKYRFAVTGSQTASRDLPVAGSYEFDIESDYIAGSSVNSYFDFDFESISVDWVNSIVSGYVEMRWYDSPLSVETPFTAKLDRVTGKFTGKINHVRFPGEIEGVFYGPEARELGAVVRLGDATTKGIAFVNGVAE